MAEIADCSAADAENALNRYRGNGRAAVLHLLRGLPPESALAVAARHPRLRDALTAKSATD